MKKSDFDTNRKNFKKTEEVLKRHKRGNLKKNEVIGLCIALFSTFIF